MNEVVKIVVESELSRTKENLHWWATESCRDDEIIALNMRKYRYAFMSVMLVLWQIGSVSHDEYISYTTELKNYYHKCVSLVRS